MLKKNFLFLIISIFCISCATDTSVDTVDGQKLYRHDDPKVQEPSFARNNLDVRNVVSKQIQRDDFNGVFFISPEEILLVQDYWSGEFNRLTQPGSYNKFFQEFRLQMKRLSAYYGNDVQKEKMMVSAEKNFYEFCVSMNIDEEYKSWKNKISAW